MGSYQVQACNCEDFPCCGCPTETVLTGQDAIEEYYRELEARTKNGTGDCDGHCEDCKVINCEDRSVPYNGNDRNDPDSVNDDEPDNMLDMEFEDRIGGGGAEF